MQQWTRRGDLRLVRYCHRCAEFTGARLKGDCIILTIQQVYQNIYTFKNKTVKNSTVTQVQDYDISDTVIQPNVNFGFGSLPS